MRSFNINRSQEIWLDYTCGKALWNVIGELQHVHMTQEALALNSWRSNEQDEYIFREWPAILKYKRRIANAWFGPSSMKNTFLIGELVEFIEDVERCKNAAREKISQGDFEHLNRIVSADVDSVVSKLNEVYSVEKQYSDVDTIVLLRQATRNAIDRLKSEPMGQASDISELRHFLELLLIFLGDPSLPDRTVVPIGTFEKIEKKLVSIQNALGTADKLHALIGRVLELIRFLG